MTTVVVQRSVVFVQSALETVVIILDRSNHGGPSASIVWPLLEYVDARSGVSVVRGSLFCITTAWMARGDGCKDSER